MEVECVPVTILMPIIMMMTMLTIVMMIMMIQLWWWWWWWWKRWWWNLEQKDDRKRVETGWMRSRDPRGVCVFLGDRHNQNHDRSLSWSDRKTQVTKETESIALQGVVILGWWDNDDDKTKSLWRNTGFDQNPEIETKRNLRCKNSTPSIKTSNAKNDVKINKIIAQISNWYYQCYKKQFWPTLKMLLMSQIILHF